MIDLFEELGDALRPSANKAEESKFESVKPDSYLLDNIQPTVREIKHLVHFYTQVICVVDYCQFTGEESIWDYRDVEYAKRRISYYSQFLTTDEVQEIRDEVYENFNSPDDDIPDDIHDRGSNSHFND